MHGDESFCDFSGLYFPVWRAVWIENEIAMDDFREMQVTESIEVPSVAKAMDPKRGAWSVKSGAENVSPSAMLRIVGA
jgi:hypothetical protein